MVSIQDFRNAIETQDVKITPKALRREGTDDVEEFIRQVAGEYLEQQMGSANYYPVRLDPEIHNIGVVYGMSPVLTYLEQRGRRTASDTTKIDYLRYLTGHTNEWIGETDSTSGDGEATTEVKSATMKLSAMPISMSDLIGMGASARARAQLMDYAQIALREDTNAMVVDGDKSVTTKGFDGIDTIIQASGHEGTAIAYELDTNGDVHGMLKGIRALETAMWEGHKTRPSFIMAKNSIVDLIVSEMGNVARYNSQGNALDIVAGINVPAFNSNTGPIPIIQDPNAEAGMLFMKNENHIFIEDFMTSSYITKGRSKPFASDGWLGQILVMYDVAPELGGYVDVAEASP